jgi:hypothetical protein
MVLLWASPLSAADKVDVLQLRNGDRITCEIKRLNRSVLTVSTDPLGTVSVYWGQVAGLESPREFDIQLASGEQFYGRLLAAPPNQLVVALGAGSSATLALADVVRLVPIGNGIWDRVDGSLDAGFSFAQANLETHLTVNGTGSYRSPKYLLSAGYASQVTTREDADRLFRSDLMLSANRFLSNRWYTIGWGAFQQNDELALDLRALAGGGIGRDLVHTNRRLWSTYAGLAYNYEQYADEPSDGSAEAAIGGQLDFFTPASDDFSITNRVVTYFNLARARVRVELQSAWRHEFLKDFYWSLNGYESFDGDPPAEQKKNDFSASFTLGWKF